MLTDPELIKLCRDLRLIGTIGVSGEGHPANEMFHTTVARCISARLSQLYADAFDREEFLRLVEIDGPPLVPGPQLQRPTAQ